MVIPKSNKALWYQVLGVRLLPVLLADPENAYPAAIARRAEGLPCLSCWFENDVRFALKALEALGVLESTKTHNKDAGTAIVRMYGVTPLGMLLLALGSQPCNVTLES